MPNQQQKKPNYMNGIRYLTRNIKPFWNKNGGKICTIAGTTGLFLSGVNACRKTYKIHDELRLNGDRIRRAKVQNKDEKFIKRAYRVTTEVVKCSAKTAKHYIPSAIGATLSSYVISNGWKIEHMNFENAATMVGILSADFMNYRQNVISEHGVEADRRYMTRRRDRRKIHEAELEDGTKLTSASSEISENEGFSIDIDPSALKIWYSKETCPNVWSPSLSLRIAHLENIVRQLDVDLMYGGSVSINDVRKHFFGKKGEIGCGGMFGRVWDPGNPEHPERGRAINLHYQEDEEFMSGLTDSCWIIIDIDDEPLFELLDAKRKEEKMYGE